MVDLRDTSVPLPLRWVLAHNITHLTPWHFLVETTQIDRLRAEFRREVSGGSQPITDCLPFARRQDCDDVAAFIVHNGILTDTVIDVHLTWSTGPERSGYPSLVRYPSFWMWLKSAVDCSAEFATEADLDDIINDGPAVV